MNASVRSRYQLRLEQLLNRLRMDAASVVEQACGPSGGQADGALSNAPFHLGDQGSEEFLHDLNFALGENEEYLLGETRAALSRLKGEDFGLCQTCGAPIAAERLDAMPYARDCIECATASQAGVDVNLNTGRPRTPKDTLAPEGSMQDDRRDADGPFAETSPRHVAAVDRFAAGEPGGGGPDGGLAGSTAGDGEPELSTLRDDAGSGESDRQASRRRDREVPQSGPSGGAVGGTPAGKRAK